MHDSGSNPYQEREGLITVNLVFKLSLCLILFEG